MMVAGFGFRAGASLASLHDALHGALAACGIAEPAQHDRLHEIVFRLFAASYGSVALAARMSKLRAKRRYF